MSLKRYRQLEVGSAPRRTRHAYGRMPDVGQPAGPTEAEYPPSENPSISYLALPRELRDQIYHEIWRKKLPFEVALPAKGDSLGGVEVYGMGDSYHFFKIFYELLETNSPTIKPSTKPQSFSAKSSRTRVKTKPPGPWFLTNKQTLHEAMEQFNRQAAWSYISSSYGRKERQLAVWKPLYTKRRSTRTGPKLLALRNASTIDMPNLLTMYVHGEMDANEIPITRLIFDRTTVELLQVLEPSLAGTMSLKSLSIALSANAWSAAASNHPVTIDLGPLLRLDLPNLQLLRLSVRHHHRFRGDERLMASLRDSVSEMGRNMVGGERRMEFEAGELPTDAWRIVFTRR